MVVSPETAGLSVEAPDGRVVFELTGVSFWRAEAEAEMKFGAFRFEETRSSRPAAAAEFGSIEKDDSGLGFELLAADGTLLGTARVEAGAEGELVLTVEAAPADHNRTAAAWRCTPGEHFLGFGGQSYDVDHRGQVVPIWVAEDGISKIPTDEYDPASWFLVGRRHSTHTPMPMYLSSRGFMLLADTPRRTIFDMGSGQEDTVRVETWEGRLELHLFDGPGPGQAIERMTAFVGRPTMPPAFAFAPWLDAIFGSDNVRRVAGKLREQNVPCSVIWTEDWRGGEASGDEYTLDEDWEVDRELYPDFEQLADDLHHSGFKFLIYNNTFLDSETGTYQEAVEGGHTILDQRGEPYLFTSAKFTPTSLVDLADPDAVAWTRQKYRDGLELGADGYMADYAEWLPTDAVLHGGADPWERHNLYPVDFQRLNRALFDEMEAEDGVERLFFVRSAYLGSQPLVSVVWAGDQQTDFSAGDGLPSVIPMGIGLGVCGFPFYGHDIAGYMSQLSEPADRELWFRWVTLGALSPVMRTHHGKSALANWNWESDEESTAHFRRWARLHIRMYPYLAGLADEAVRTGMPMMRPLALGHPEFERGWTLTDQYLLGDRLLVAPVVEGGARSRTVELPAGDWCPLEGGACRRMAEPGSVEVDAPLTEIPVFVPAGCLLVLLPEEIDTLAPASDQEVVTLGDVGDDRELWLWPGGSSQWGEPSGLSYNWQADDLELPVEEAVFEGAPVEVHDGTIEITGNGTLVLDGTAELVIEGGDPERRVMVRMRRIE